MSSRSILKKAINSLCDEMVEARASKNDIKYTSLENTKDELITLLKQTPMSEEDKETEESQVSSLAR